MFGHFCGGAQHLKDQINLKMEETKDGIRVEVTAKDPERTGDLKSLVKGIKGFCGPDCC